MVIKFLIVVMGISLIVFIMGSIYFFWFSFIRWKPRYKGDYNESCSRNFRPFQTEIMEGKSWIHSHRSNRITITSNDGLQLIGYYIPTIKPSKDTILLMHGYRSDSYTEFSCLSKFFHENGYNLLIAHQRCHGESEGKYIGFGVLERYDCKQWIEYLNKYFGVNQNLYLAGISMGCSTVLMTLGLDLPTNVKGVIADCGFTSPYDIFKHILKRDFHMPPFPMLQIENFLCKHRIGYSFNDCSTLDILKKNEVPILFIHGEKDDYVPTWMGRKNYEVCKGKKELIIIKDAKHATSSMQAAKEYRYAVLKFLNEIKELNHKI